MMIFRLTMLEIYFVLTFHVIAMKIDGHIPSRRAPAQRAGIRDPARGVKGLEGEMRMSEQASGEQGYTMGYTEEFLQLLARRSAQNSAAHLLPHLKSGQRLLDFGCGPGSISVGLATAVAPGELHGIDMEESQVMMARAAAKAGGHDNATFHVGDATALPFDDDYFDVAHCHAVLMHVPATQATLAEVKPRAEARRDRSGAGNVRFVIVLPARPRRNAARVEHVFKPPGRQRRPS